MAGILEHFEEQGATGRERRIAPIWRFAKRRKNLNTESTTEVSHREHREDKLKSSPP